MPVLSRGRRDAAVAALFVARVVYAFNWYNVGGVLPLIGSGLHAGTAALGVVLGAFLLGVSIFQVPAGLASVRFGPRRVALAGVAVLGAASVASAFAWNWPALAAFRFLGGVGAAFFFSPALALIASYYPPSQRGPAIGLYNGGFSLGGALGLFSGALIGISQGWAAALAYGGLAMLVATAVAWAVVPNAPDGPPRSPTTSVRSAGIAVVRSRSIWALALGLSGFWAGVYIVAQDFVDFAHAVHPSWSIGVVAPLTALVIVTAFPGGPFGGWIAERGRDRRLLVGAYAGLASLLVLAVPFLSLLELWPTFLALGFLDGMVFAILYLIPSYLPESEAEALALGVGVVNSIQVMVGSLAAIAFGFIVEGLGYTDAWVFAGLLSVGLLPLLFLVRPNRGVLARPTAEGARA